MQHDDKPTCLDLFAGIGGFTLAYESVGFRTVAYSEICPDACRVFEHWFPGVPNIGDIRTVSDRVLDALRGVDVVTGGVPCQPASALGQMRGTEDERWLWPETIRVVSRVRPRFFHAENPPAILTLQGGTAWNGIVRALAALGYDCWWDVVPAAAFGAGHLRERVMLIAADATHDGKRAWRRGKAATVGFDCEGGAVADVSCSGREIRSGLCEGNSGRSGRGRSSDVHGQETFSADSSGARLQGHAGNGHESEGRPHSRRSVAPPDLRGRFHSENWWHEDVTGIPVLVHGLSGRLAEAACRVTGNAVVPQAVRPFAEAIYQSISERMKRK